MQNKFDLISVWSTSQLRNWKTVVPPETIIIYMYYIIYFVLELSPLSWSFEILCSFELITLCIYEYQAHKLSLLSFGLILLIFSTLDLLSFLLEKFTQFPNEICTIFQFELVAKRAWRFSISCLDLGISDYFGRLSPINMTP